jgi:uncharacterized Zn-binding protein involved in type VI secretion
MAQPVVRLGDGSSHGGTMVTASGGNVFADGPVVCISGDQHSCPIPHHGVTSVQSSSIVTANGTPILRNGDVAGCGAVLTGGDPQVLAD